MEFNITLAFIGEVSQGRWKYQIIIKLKSCPLQPSIRPWSLPKLKFGFVILVQTYENWSNKLCECEKSSMKEKEGLTSQELLVSFVKARKTALERNSKWLLSVWIHTSTNRTQKQYIERLNLSSKHSNSSYKSIEEPQCKTEYSFVLANQNACQQKKENLSNEYTNIFELKLKPISFLRPQVPVSLTLLHQIYSHQKIIKLFCAFQVGCILAFEY